MLTSLSRCVRKYHQAVESEIADAARKEKKQQKAEISDLQSTKSLVVSQDFIETAGGDEHPGRRGQDKEVRLLWPQFVYDGWHSRAVRHLEQRAGCEV
jgi:hypothetical protein